jgi:hypothetical protein
MKHTLRKPCSQWAEKLTTLHPDDLSPTQQQALHEHMQTCIACSTAYNNYQMLRERLLALPPVEALSRAKIQEILTKQQDILEEQERETYTHAFFSIQKGDPIRSQHQFSAGRRLINNIMITFAVFWLIVGSLLLFLHHYTPITTTGSVEKRVIATKIPTTMPNADTTEHDCNQFNSSPDDIDEGIQQVCQTHLVTKTNITEQFGDGYTATLQDAYADGVRIFLKFAIQNLTSVTTPMFDSTLTIGHGSATRLISGSSHSWFDVKSKSFIVIENFDATSIDVNTKSLQLRIQLNLETAPAGSGNNSLTSISAPDIYITIPFHPAHIANINQTLTNSGVSVTLSRVLVSPSSVRVELLGSILRIPNSSDGLNAYYLARGDWNTSQGLGFTSGGFTTNIGVDLEVNRIPPDIQGEWTLQLLGGAVQNTPGSWIFQFTIPN